MPSQSKVIANIVPHEVVLANALIVIESPQALDPKSAQGGIVVPGVKGDIRLSRDGRVATWSADEALPMGHHVLLIGGLLTNKQRQIEADAQIPFFVTDSLAKIPRTARVESMARMRFHDLGVERIASDRRPDGPYVEIMKASHRKTGAPIEMAFDEAGRAIEPQRYFQQVLENRVKKFGKIQDSLYARLHDMGADSRISVAFWLRSAETFATDEKKLKGETKQPARAMLERRRGIAKSVASFAKRYPELHAENRFRADRVAPVVYAESNRDQITMIARDPEVIGVFLYEPEGLEDLGNSIGIANSDDAHTLGYKGAGVKVAVWEDAPDVATNLTIAAFYKSTGFAISQHARHTHGIVKNKEPNKPHGHAPSCALYSANSKDIDALRWAAMDRGCTVISQSFHRSSEPGSSSMSYDDIYKDWLALQWPYPTIVQAAGNYWQGDPDGIQPPRDEYVNHKGFNGLTVGNHDDSAASISGDSVFRNPASTHGDRELPEIAANGTAVTTVGLTMSGTSMAAPAAAGCAALVQSVDATLKSWPEGCRAILFAGAKRNIAGKTWWQDVVANVDASDGTGALDALDAVNIAKQRRGRNTAASARGWDVGTLRSGDIERNRQTTFSYSVKVPTGIFAPRHVKVALAWDSNVTEFSIFGINLLLGSALTVDLDLQVFDSRGNQVGYSGSWDNSYEIAEFEGKPGETYTIKIRRWSGVDDVWYGIAWTVTGGLFWVDATRASVLQEALANRLRGG